MGGVKDIKEEIREIHTGTKFAFSKVKTELTEHLDSINQNTNEIQILYGYLAELENKLDKLSERMDRINMSDKRTMEQDMKISLTPREEEIFITLYMSSKIMTSSEIAKVLGLTDELVNTHIFKLISKGIPIQKDFFEEKSYFSLDRTFKDLQARKNIIKISEHVLEQFAQLSF